VRNEFEMGENSPVGILMERIVSTAFLWHNYGKSTIGTKSDIERVPVENLREFYRRYYQPDNAMLVVAGKFEPGPVLSLIQETFGAIPRPDRELDATYTEEPVQDGPRFVELRRVASEQAAGAAYHVCAGSHPDSAALQVLGELLTSEPSGRLYRALVPKDLATGVFAFPFSTAEPGVFLALASSTVDQDVKACHDTLVATLESVGQAEIGAEEVERAKNKLLKDIRLSLNDSGRIGVELSEWAALGDWRMFFVNRDRLKDVTPADVSRVAARYFVTSNRTSGIFEPTDDPTRAEIPATPDVSALVEGYEGTETIARGEAFEPTPQNIERRTQRLDVAGIRVAFLPKESRGNQVVMSLGLHYGTEESVAGHDTALEMLPEMLMRGTEERDYQALKDEIDRLQSRVSLFGGPGELGLSATSDREHLPALIALIGEILRTPSFPAEEFQILKDERLGQIESGLTDPQALAFTALARALAPFPPESVHYVPTLEEALARTRAVTVDEIRSLYQTLVGGGHIEVGLVGDFDPETVERALTAALGGWASPAPYERIRRPHVPLEAGAKTIDTPDKRMAVVIVATSLPMKDDAPDYAALDFANYVLGASAKSRILTTLRHEGGLSYGAGSRLRVSSEDEEASLSGFAICAPENAQEAHRAMRAEFDSWIE
jgi:zinc protease